MTVERVTPNLTAHYNSEMMSAIKFFLKEGNWPIGVKIGIIFEGGALRGVLSCGYGLALTEYIKPTSVYSIYGSSSGALNAIYYADQSLDVGLKIYAENATDKMCTNIAKFPNVLNPDWLVDEWLFGKRSFDVRNVVNGEQNIWLSLTNMLDGSPRYFNARGANIEELRKAMKATCYAPLLCNKVQYFDGVPFGDGATSDAIPYDKAISDGCTHIICLLTRPPEYRKRHTWLAKALETLRLAHLPAAYRKAYFERDRTYSALLDRLYLGEGGLRVPTWIVHPAAKDEAPGNVETNPDVIWAKGQQAVLAAASALKSAIKPD